MAVSKTKAEGGFGGVTGVGKRYGIFLRGVCSMYVLDEEDAWGRRYSEYFNRHSFKTLTCSLIMVDPFTRRKKTVIQIQFIFLHLFLQ